MNILIVGCGKLGSQVSNELDALGHNVSVVDSDPDHFVSLRDDFDGNMIEGDAMDTDVLKEAGIEMCDSVIITTADDNLNITVSQIVKEIFGLENVMVRINDTEREEIFNNFGLKSICSTKLASHAIIASLKKSEYERVFSFGNATFSFSIDKVPKSLVGVKVSEVKKMDGKMYIGILTSSGETILRDTKSDKYIDKTDKIITFKVID